MKSNRSIWFWSVGYALFVLMTGTNIPSPLYSVYMHQWKFSSGTLTLVFATYALFIIPSLLWFGQLSDRIGRKKVLIPGLCVATCGSVLFAIAHSVTWLFVARALQGLAVGILSGAATAALAELHPKQDRKMAAVLASVATAGGTALGPVVGGVLAQYAPWPMTLPYVVHVIWMVPGWLACLWMPETVSPSVARGSLWRVQKPGVPRQIRGAFTVAAAAAFVTWAVTALFMAVVPSYVTSLMHIHNLAVAGGVVFLMLGSSTAVQMVLQRLGFRSSSMVGLLLLVVGLCGVVWAVPMQSVAFLLMSTVVTGCGQGLAFKGSMVLASEIAPSDRRADVISSYYVVIYMGVGIPVVGVGYLAQAIGLFHAMEWFAGIVGVLGLLLFAWIAVRFSSGMREHSEVQATVS